MTDGIWGFIGVLVTVIVTTLVAAVTWFKNEKSKRLEAQRTHKEKIYTELITNLSGFYVNTFDLQKKERFILHYRLCWLYSPDEVIRKLNLFFTLVSKQASPDHTPAERENVVAELLLEMRKDLAFSKEPLAETTLSPKEFMHIEATNK